MAFEEGSESLGKGVAPSAGSATPGHALCAGKRRRLVLFWDSLLSPRPPGDPARLAPWLLRAPEPNTLALIHRESSAGGWCWKASGFAEPHLRECFFLAVLISLPLGCESGGAGGGEAGMEPWDPGSRQGVYHVPLF